MGLIINTATTIRGAVTIGHILTIPSIVSSGLKLNLDPAVYTSGATWNDSSPSGYNATLTGSPTFNTSPIKYFTLNGTSQYASVPTSATGLDDLYLTGFTYQVWGKFSIATGAPPVVSKGDSGSGMGQRMTFMDQISPVTLDVLVDYTNLGLEKAVSSTYATLSFGTWYLCSMTWSYSGSLATQTESNLHVYVNGVEYATTSGTSDTWTSAVNGTKASDSGFATYFGYSPQTDYYNIGGRGPARYAPMGLGQCLVYNRALTGTEISQNFDATKANYGY